MTSIRDARTVSLCAGPGGGDEGARILGGRRLLDDLGTYSIEWERWAAATARAAEHHRKVQDITKFRPAWFRNATGLVLTLPCDTFAKSGLRTGMADYGHVLDSAVHLPGCSCDLAAARDAMAADVADERTALMAEAYRWATEMPALEWIVAEQAEELEYFWEDLTAELFSLGWESADVFVMDANTTLGLPVRRTRSYMVARRFDGFGRNGFPHDPIAAAPTFAQALGWPEGERVNTRGNRKTGGGSGFCADGPGWGLTSSSRSWFRESDGQRITPAEGGWMLGFPLDYPWQGSNTAQWRQVADVLTPPAAAIALGCALGIDWRGPLDRWHANRTLTSPARVRAAHDAGALFDLTAAS